MNVINSKFPIMNAKQPKISKENCPMTWDRIRTVAHWTNNSKKVYEVFEIGFGHADLEEFLLDNSGAYKWYGIDISKKSVENAREKYLKRVFEVGDITNNTRFSNNKFDIILALESLST